MTATSKISKLADRLKFEAGAAVHLTRANLWNLASISSVNKAMQEGCLHQEIKEGPLKGDPFLANPKMHAGYLEEPIEEYVYKIKGPVTIEPDYGFALLNPAHIMFKSLPYSHFNLSHKTIRNFSSLPNLTRLLTARNKTLPVRREKSVINMHYIYPENYYHAHQDVLGKLGMFDEYGISKDVPLVISPKASETRLFKAIVDSGKLGKRKWIVQDQFYIEADEVIFGKSCEGNRSRLDYLMDELEAPKTNPAINRRIYLTRGPQRGRNLTNAQEIFEIVSGYGFEVVDTEEMTFEEQMKLFSETGYLISAHGAGLINIIYRRDAPLHLLELFPSDYVMLHYYLICKMFGFDYSYLLGQSSKHVGIRPDFSVDAQSVQSILQTWFPGQ